MSWHNLWSRFGTPGLCRGITFARRGASLVRERRGGEPCTGGMARDSTLCDWSVTEWRRLVHVSHIAG